MLASEILSRFRFYGRLFDPGNNEHDNKMFASDSAPSELPTSAPGTKQFSNEFGRCLYTNK